MGNRATAKDAASSVIIGNGTSSTVKNAVVIGGGKAESGSPNAAKVSVEGGIALGLYSDSNRQLTDSTGYDPKTGTASTKTDKTWVGKIGALAIGGGDYTRQITGVAAGTNDTDAVNVAQLKEATLHFVSINKGNNNNVTTGNNYANDGATGTDAIAIGIGAKRRLKTPSLWVKTRKLRRKYRTPSLSGE